MKLSRERVGDVCILSEAVLWGAFPVITILSFTSLTPLVSLGWSTLFASVVFAVLLTVRGKWSDVWNRRAMKDVLLTAFVLGFLYYILFFFGLQYTSAGNASIIALSELFFSYCFFHLFRKEHIPPIHLIGAVLMIFAAGVILYPNIHAFQIGDLLILGASLIAPFGNLLQRRARIEVSSESIMFVRSVVTTVAVFCLAYAFGTNPLSINFDGGIVWILLINGIFLFGFSKILWIEGIHRISVTKANALASLSPLVTLLFAYVLLSAVPTVWQVFAFVPMFLGVLLLSHHKQKTPTL